MPPGSRYLVTGGGTGGHVYPAIAIADEIKRRDPTARFLYVGVRGKSEARIVPRRGYPLKFVTAEGWPGKRPIPLARFSLKLALGILKSLFLILTFRPRLIIGTGGYVSAPIMMAAILLRRLGLFKGKTFIHEQNTFPGKLNRLVGALVDTVGVSFPESLKYFPKTGVFVGYPVRRELGFADREEARAALKIPHNKRVVFAFGGSQGARTINRALVAALPALRDRGDLFIIHGTGTYQGPGYQAVADTEACLESAGLGAPMPDLYLRQDYFHNIEQVYAVSDLVVCRAGAGTLTELTARGLPSLIIPKANLPGDHQVKNARVLAAAGAGQVLYERVELTSEGIVEQVSGQILADAISALLDDTDRLDAMRQASQSYYRSEALDRIGDVLAGMLAPTPGMPADIALQPATPELAGPDFESMGPAALIGHLTKHLRQQLPPLDPADLEYLQYRTDDYLASTQWQVRNRGVKLVGLLGYRERLPLLLYLLDERKRVGLMGRLMGGDYEQVGFIRRNIFEALIQLDVASPEVHRAIEDGLDDPYFEVRTRAANVAAHFASRLGEAQPRIEEKLRRRLSGNNFEVICAVALAIGEVATQADTADIFKPFLYSKYWMIRQAIVVALDRLIVREVISQSQVSVLVDNMLITSNGFQPRFPLKVELQKLGGTLQQLTQRTVAPAPDVEDDT